MLTATAMTSMRNYIKGRIAYARYKVGDAYHRAEIEDAMILADGRIAITFVIDHTIAGNVTVTEVQLYDRNGALWASKAESIARADATEGVVYRFRFAVEEES